MPTKSVKSSKSKVMVPGVFASFLGAAVFVRTVTHYYTGELVDVADGMLVLEDAAWIADTARWGKALSSGELNEVEPYPAGQVLVSLGAVVDISAWKHALPREAK